VVIKPAEQACAAVMRMGELLADVLPPGVLNIVSGLGEEAGDPLVRHRDVKKITMTGSPGTARTIQRAAADTPTQSVSAPGGKNPHIICADADLDKAALAASTGGAFIANAGQGCGCGSRILIQRPILDEMLQRIKAHAETVVLGDVDDKATS